MKTIANIIGPVYQKLLEICEKRKISINLDIENPSIKVFQEKQLMDFLKNEVPRAIKSCKAGDHIAIIQKSIPDSNMSRISIKSSGETLSEKVKKELQEQGYEVRARFGYDTIVSIKI